MITGSSTSLANDEKGIDCRCKINLCGATGSGKTSLLKTAFAEKKSSFSADEKHTETPSFHTLDVTSQIEDDPIPRQTATRFYADGPDQPYSDQLLLSKYLREYYKNATAVICCVDTSAADWQTQIETQYKNYTTYAKDASFIVVATKGDSRVNNFKAIQEYTRRKKIEFFSSSAKTGVLLDKNGHRYDLQSLPQQIELIIRAKRKVNNRSAAESASSASIQEVQAQPEADSSSISTSAATTSSSPVELIETVKPEPLNPKILIIGSLSVGFVLLGFASLVSYPLNVWSAASVVAPYLFIGGAALFLVSTLLMSLYGWVGKLWNDHKIVAVCSVVLSALLFTDLGLFDSKFSSLFGEKAALSATLGVFFSGLILLVLNFAYVGVKLWECCASKDNTVKEEHSVPAEQVERVLHRSLTQLRSIGDEETDSKTLNLTNSALPTQVAWKKHETMAINRNSSSPR